MWSAPTTTDRDRKELLNTLLSEVGISLDRPAGHADLVLRWKGGAITDLRVPLISRTARLRTDENTVDLVRRLAQHYPDGQIAGILNRQKRSTATGLPFTAGRVQRLRHNWNIPCHQGGTPGAPWRIHLTDDVRARFVDQAPDGWLAMLEATHAHGVSRNSIMNSIKTGSLQAVYARTGRRKGLRIEPPAAEQTLFQP